MATRMVQEGSIARTPEQLEVWIAEHPEFAQRLSAGGYGDKFDAGELVPLLEVFLAQAGAPAAVEEAPAPAANWFRPVAVVLALLLLGAAIAAVALW